MKYLRLCVYVAKLYILFYGIHVVYGLKKIDKKDLHNLREEVRQMFQHAYNSYLKYAYPYDELRPLSCDGVDTWGSYSLTLIDALDTLAVMGNYTEFQRVVDIVTTHANFDANINVSVFETNIRIIGGLLSAHMLSYRAGVAVEPGWPCNGPLLHLAEDVARRLIAAFDTATGMPYGTVNLRHGVPDGETSVTCTAGVGTFILEMGTLSRLTGDPLFEEVAMNALHALHHHRSSIGLVGNHIDVQTGRWTAQDAGIGAGVDSYYEYLAKGAVLLQRPELMHMFNEGRAAIDKYLKRGDWHLWVSMSKGQVTLPVFQSLEAYWPGVLSLIGDVHKGMKSLHNYHQVWKQYGFTPEFYNIPQGEVGSNREGYPLRPELIESVMYLYRATGDQYLLEVGKDILRSIQHSAKTPCGYATIKDVRDHRKEDRMESFFLAETTKYLYLLFDPDNFIHNRGQHGTVVKTPWGECILEAGGYIFNTEAHPIDPGALHCCTGHRQSDVQAMLQSADPAAFRGERLSTLRQRPSSLPSTRAAQASQVDNPGLLEEISKNRAAQMQQEEEAAEKTVKKERENFLEKFVTEMGGAIDVIRLSTQEMEGPKIISENNGSEGKVNNAAANAEKESTSDKAHKNSDQSDLQSVIESNFKTTNEFESAHNASENNHTRLRSDEIQGVGSVEVLGSSSVDFESDAGTDSKGDMLDYRADDSDRVYAVRNQKKEELQLNLSEKVGPDDNNDSFEEDKETEDKSWKLEENYTPSSLPSFVAQFLLSKPTVKPKFDPQALLERLREEAKYKRNITWEQHFELLTCSAQPFLQRLSMSGEVFGPT